MARVPYPDLAEVPEEYRALLNPQNPHIRTDDDDWHGEMDDIEDSRNTHRALANNPQMLDAYRRFAASLWQDTGLSARERELTILAVARTLDSKYEWKDHVVIALRAGVSESEIEAVGRWDLSDLDDSDRALLEYARRFVAGGVTDAVHDAFVEQFDVSTLVGVNLLAGYYLLIVRMADALDLDFEEEFMGWTLEEM
jgi:alkylhydroperoxidase family enzyme